MTSAAGELSLSPADGEVLDEPVQYFSADVTGVKKVIFMIDGKSIGVGDSNGKIKAPDLSFGKHTLAAVSMMEDGTVLKEESKFEIRKNVIYKSHVQDFNTFSEDVSEIGFTVENSQNANISAVSGVSGEESDKALKLEVNTDEKLVVKNPSLQSDSFVNYNKGISVIEFDIKPNTDKENVIIKGAFLWENSFYFIKDGIWLGTEKNVSMGWTHAKIVTNADTKRITFSIKEEGKSEEVLINNKKYGENADYNNEFFKIATIQTSAREDGEERCGFSIDNFSAKNSGTYAGITKLTYVQGGAEYDDISSVPTLAEAVKIYMAEGIVDSDISTDSVSLVMDDGCKFPILSASYNGEDNSITIIPKEELVEDSNITVLISFPEGHLYEGNYTERMHTNANVINTSAAFSVNGNSLYAGGQIETGSVISVNISAGNIKDAETNAVYVLSVRKGSRLVAMTSKTVTLAALGSDSFSLTLPKITKDGDYKVYLMVCDNLKDCNAIGNYVVVE